LFHAAEPAPIVLLLLVCEFEGELADLNEQDATEDVLRPAGDSLPSVETIRDGQSAKLNFHVDPFSSPRAKAC
jgi:hypothetical protein